MSRSGRMLGGVAFTAGAAAGALLSWRLERRLVGAHRFADDPEWQALQAPLPARTSHITSFDGTRLAVEELGPADGPLLVLAHGYATCQRCWYYQRRDLAGTFRVVSYDHRGHGESDEAANGDYSVTALGRDLAAVLDAVVPPDRQAVVAGHSMGGMTVLSYAEQFPDRLRRLVAGVVLLATADGEILAGGVTATSIAALGAAQRRAVERLFAGMARRPHVVERVYGASSDLSYLITRGIGLNPNARPAHVAFIEQLLLNCPNSVVATLGPVLTALDLRDAPRHVQVPALLIAGERDRLTPPAQVRKLAEALPKAELVELPGIGHVSPLEAHEAVTAQLRLFAGGLLQEEPGWRWA